MIDNKLIFDFEQFTKSENKINFDEFDIEEKDENGINIGDQILISGSILIYYDNTLFSDPINVRNMATRISDKKIEDGLILYKFIGYSSWISIDKAKVVKI